MAFSTHMAGRLSVAIQEAELRIPWDVAILGHGNRHDRLDLCAPVPLSSISTEPKDYAQACVRILQDSIDEKDVPRKAVAISAPRVILRESTDVLASSDPLVAAAIRYMWDHLRKDMSVGDIAEGVGSSRRNLERRFTKEMGRGPAAELRRRRLEECLRLLRSTDLSITDIAPLCGFKDKTYMHAVFQKTFGMTPRKWRLKNQ
jgi:LacI family transcriptional regulator